MLPIAAGLGEGGRILQPLGIAVSGGLWVSMGLTLFVVPALQVSYLEWRAARRGRAAPLETRELPLGASLADSTTGFPGFVISTNGGNPLPRSEPMSEFPSTTQ